MGVPIQAVPVINNANATEDPKIRSCLVELQAILSGGVDSSNIQDGTIAKVDLASSALQAFLQLTTPAVLKLAHGSATMPFAGVLADTTVTVAHGMSGTPTRVFAMYNMNIATGPTIFWASADGTNIVFRGHTSGGDPSMAFSWVALV